MARERTPFLYQVHTGTAMVFCAALPLAPAPSNIAWVCLLGAFVIRLPWLFKPCLPLLLQPLAWFLFLFVLWTGLSMDWSTDPDAGFRLWRTARLVVTPILLWPVLDRLPWLIVCFLIGVLTQNVLQIIDITGLASISPEDEAHRAGGLLHPTLTGAFCVTAMCWYAAAFLNATRVWMIAAAIGGLLAAFGLVISGSRGGWVAAFIALVLMWIISVYRFPQVRRRCVMSIILFVLLFAVSWPLTGSMIRTGVGRASEEFQMMQEDQTYNTSTGLRVLMWEWASRAFIAHPVIGIGIGSFKDYIAEQPEYLEAAESDPNTARYMLRDHAHSDYLQVLATTGIIGLILFVAILLLILYQSWRDLNNHIFAIGSFFAAIGWCISAQFDSLIYIGGMMGLLMILASATTPMRSPLRLKIPASDATDMSKTVQVTAKKC